MRHRLGIIGGGNMGTAIARGGFSQHVFAPHEVVIADLDGTRRRALEPLGCRVTTDPAEAAAGEEVILAVKPQAFSSVADAIAPLVEPTIVITIMAGIGTEVIRDRLGARVRVIRAMPNTPCQVGEGMTGLALGAGAEPGDERFARDIFEALGRTVVLDESQMHAVTAVSGSGPAYVYYLAELMQQAATEIGLSERDAQLLVVQTVIGAGRMLREAELEPAELRRIVTTPGGTTAAALDVMTRGDLAGVFVDAIRAARDRGRELGRIG